MYTRHEKDGLFVLGIEGPTEIGFSMEIAEDELCLDNPVFSDLEQARLPAKEDDGLKVCEIVGEPAEIIYEAVVRLANENDSRTPIAEQMLLKETIHIAAESGPTPSGGSQHHAA